MVDHATNLTTRLDRTPVDVVRAYFELIKPRETFLLAFTGAVSAVVASGGRMRPSTVGLVGLTLIAGSAGANGATNYLDRGVDEKMMRTRWRPLPSGRVSPAGRALPVIVCLLVVGLVLAWAMEPWAFVVGLVGTAAALIGRKTSATHVLGILSSCCPVLIGWLVVRHSLDPSIALMCLLIVAWVPLHVWSVMLAYRDDYLGAGVNIFPLTVRSEVAIRCLMGLSVLLVAASLALGRTGGFGSLYLAASVLLGTVMLLATVRLAATGGAESAWRVYKLSAYPYLGLLFLAMLVDRLVA